MEYKTISPSDDGRSERAWVNIRKDVVGSMVGLSCLLWPKRVVGKWNGVMGRKSEKMCRVECGVTQECKGGLTVR